MYSLEKITLIFSFSRRMLAMSMELCIFYSWWNVVANCRMTLVCVKPILYSPMTWLSAKTCLAFQFHLSLLATCAFMIDSAQTKSTLKLSGITTFISAFDVLILVLDILKPFFRSSDFRSFVPQFFRILCLTSIRINLRLQQRYNVRLSF